LYLRLVFIETSANGDGDAHADNEDKERANNVNNRHTNRWLSMPCPYWDVDYFEIALVQGIEKDHH
jgi:hypothetical protein